MSYEKQIDGRTKRALDTAIAKRQVSQDSYRAVMEGRITLQEAKDLGRENSPFGKRGARLVALDDWGDDSHEGELLRYLKGWVSKGERLKTAERTRRGRLRKAREGKVVGDGKPNYGFRLNEARDGYEVDEGEACLVRRVFAMLASGSAVNEVVRALRREGFPSPSGGPASSWSHSQIRNVVFSEVYMPHDREEPEALCEEGLVARGVLAGLDPGARYGVWWFNTRRHARERTRERRADGSYKEAVRREAKDRREWLAVPVPDAGVPAADVRRARERLAGRSRPSRAAGRFWELAGGGVLRCGECGGGMRARSVRRPKTGKTDFYYTCNAAFRRDGRCAHATVYPAGAVEREVVVLVDDLLSDPERVTRELDEAIAREELNHRDPGGAAEFWAIRPGELARARAKNQEMFRADAMTLGELRAETARLDGEREAAEEELARARDAGGRLAGLRAHREAVIGMLGAGLALGLMWFPPRLRRQAYEALGLRAMVHPGGPLGPGHGPNVTAEGWLDAGAWRYTRGARRVRAETCGGRGAAARGGAGGPRGGLRGYGPGPRGQLDRAARVGPRGARRPLGAGAPAGRRRRPQSVPPGTVRQGELPRFAHV